MSTLFSRRGKIEEQYGLGNNVDPQQTLEMTEESCELEEDDFQENENVSCESEIEKEYSSDRNELLDDEAMDQSQTDGVQAISRDSNREDPYLEGMADSLVIAFFIALFIKIFLYFYDKYSGSNYSGMFN